VAVEEVTDQDNEPGDGKLTPEERIKGALGVILQYGQIDGDHHKAWVIDQTVRALTGDGYAAWIQAANFGEHGPGTYEWDEGIPP
jgi:hypothetical protein